jgi:hypothetical protein
MSGLIARPGRNNASSPEEVPDAADGPHEHVKVGEEPHRGTVDRSHVRHVAQHELDTARRLATLGFDVVFRQPMGQHTSDAYVNGMRAEFKWSSSPSSGSVKRRVSRGRKKQGPRYVLDVSESPLLIEQVVSIVQQLCDTFPDDQIATIVIIDEQSVSGPGLVRTVKEEVPQWLR